MEKLILIDKKTYKLMKYVYRHQEVRLSEITNKFDDGTALISYLCDIEYGVYRMPDGKLTLDTSELDDSGSFGLMIPGNCYVENRRNNFLKWFATTMISATALVISIIALVISSNNELFVHLIK